MSERSDLRSRVFDFAGGHCEWPGCSNQATELAHLVARGMSPVGKDVADNVMAACADHARITDLEPPPGDNGVYRLAVALHMVGVAYGLSTGIGANRPSWVRKDLVRVLRTHLRATRSAVDHD